MRVVLVGRAVERDRLRTEAVQAGWEVVGETATLSVAREADEAVDAWLVAPPAPTGVDRIEAGRRPPDEPLTAREHDVLELLAEGLPNKGIADRLGISDQTVKFHVASLIAKLGAANRTDAMRRAIRRGLVVI